MIAPQPRPRAFPVSGREPFPLPERLQGMVDGFRASVAEPFVGVTTNGHPAEGLFHVLPTGVSTAPLVAAAEALMDSLSPEQRSAVSFPIDSDAWRSWSNISPFLFRHGVLLETLAPAQRDLALALVAATLSEAGYQSARDVMRLNETIAELTGRGNEYGQWLYWLSVLGTPSIDAPWGWQIDGHHLNLNCFVLGDQVVLTPQFMGSEPVHAEAGAFAGTRVFQAEEERGFKLMRALRPEHQAQARVGPTLPPDVLAVAPNDNLVLAYEGLPVLSLPYPQQLELLDLVGVYVNRARPGHAEVRFDEVRSQLAHTYFAWVGPCEGDAPFYYRIHSPVVLIEFDHLPGIALDNDTPSRHHIHTLIRTPNGNDYGQNLLRQHRATHH